MKVGKRQMKNILCLYIGMFLFFAIFSGCISDEVLDTTEETTGEETMNSGRTDVTHFDDTSCLPTDLTDYTDIPTLPKPPAQTTTAQSTEQPTASEETTVTVEPAGSTTIAPIETGFPNADETNGTKYY